MVLTDLSNRAHYCMIFNTSVEKLTRPMQHQLDLPEFVFTLAANLYVNSMRASFQLFLFLSSQITENLFRFFFFFFPCFKNVFKIRDIAEMRVL